MENDKEQKKTYRKPRVNEYGAVEVITEYGSVPPTNTP
jgi:hypothetical protein